MAEPRTLDCAVVGAGIGGLAAGIALSRAGHRVTIYERSRFENEVGAAITLCPNGNRALRRWGFDSAAAGETIKRQTRLIKWDTLELMVRQSHEDVIEKYGYPFSAFHRADLHGALRELAEAKHGVTIKFGRQAVDVDCAQGTITFADGQTESADLIVIADGVQGRFVRAVTGEDTTVIQTGDSIFRTLIPIERLMKDPKISKMFENEPSGFLATAGTKEGFISYPCRSDTVLNVGVWHPTQEHLKDATGWSHPASKADVLATLQGWPEFWQKLVKLADEFTVFRTEIRDAIPRMANGKACLIGDAAHNMLPTFAQGGNMAIEDAAGLEVLFTKTSMGPSDRVEERLQLWNDFRMPRSSVVQFLSNRRPELLKSNITDPEQDERFKQLHKGPKLPPLDLPVMSDPWNDMLWGYDVFSDAKTALKDGRVDNVRYFGPSTQKGS